MHMTVRLRRAEDADLDAILDIHNDAILNSSAIWTDEAVDRRERELWLAQREAAGHPVIVAVVDDAVVGYATYGPWRAKSGYRFTVENSVYLAAGHRGRGIGAMLLAEIIRLAQEAGMQVMVADIESRNSASIRLHERFGFERVGTVRQVGTKFGEWLDLLILELPLQARERVHP
jgi:L-amino acid N-acyltransferase YncA